MAIYERVVVDRPPDANLGPVRALGPATVAELDRLRRGGVSMKAIAERYGISVRTAYRYLEASPTYATVDVEGWTATFAIAPGRAPWRVSRWRRA
jgi:hypothetical protein